MFVKNGTIVHFSATGKCILIMTYNIAINSISEVIIWIIQIIIISEVSLLCLSTVLLQSVVFRHNKMLKLLKLDVRYFQIFSLSK